MSDKINLPSSSYEEIVKIIKAYSHQNGPASLDDISKLTSMNKTTISGNNKFLIESGLISTGNKKTITELGRKLGRALEHSQENDIKFCWKEVVSSIEVIANLVTTVRIKEGMSTEELATHTLYVSGQKNTKSNRVGANAIIDILKVSGLLTSEDGKFVVPLSEDSEIENPVEENTTSQLTEKGGRQKKPTDNPTWG